MPVRYSFWTDRPRNVSNRDYQRYQGYCFGTFIAGGLGLGMLVVSVLGLSLQTSTELAALSGISISEALAWQGSSNDTVKLEGYLQAPNPQSMPDDDTLQVIRGELIVAARGDRNSDERVREELFRWERTADTVTLSDGSNSIPLGFNLEILPTQEDRSARARVLRAGESRISRPVEVEYEEQIFPLNPTIWEGVDSVFVDVTRRYLVQGESVTIVAGIDRSQGHAQLVDPLGDQLRVYRGSEADILRNNQQSRRSGGLFAILLLIGGYLCNREANKLYRQFEILSNQ